MISARNLKKQKDGNRLKKKRQAVRKIDEINKKNWCFCITKLEKIEKWLPNFL